MKTLVLGGSGLLGSNWIYVAAETSEVGTVVRDASVAVNIDGITVFTGLDDIERYILADFQPDVVINTIAFTNVDECEMYPKQALDLNALLPERLAQICRDSGTKLVHLSTDHLYESNTGADENLKTTPVNIYGYSKFLGDLLVLKTDPTALVIRTNFYGWGHRYRSSFSDWIIDSLRNDEVINVFDDVMFSPVFIDQLIKAVNELVNINETGVFNVASKDCMSKYDFAQKIAILFGLDQSLIKRSNIDDLEHLTQRPKNLCLESTKLAKTTGCEFSIEGGLKLLKLSEERRTHLNNMLNK